MDIHVLKKRDRINRTTEIEKPKWKQTPRHLLGNQAKGKTRVTNVSRNELIQVRWCWQEKGINIFFQTEKKKHCQ